MPTKEVLKEVGSYLDAVELLMQGPTKWVTAKDEVFKALSKIGQGTQKVGDIVTSTLKKLGFQPYDRYNALYPWTDEWARHIGEPDYERWDDWAQRVIKYTDTHPSGTVDQQMMWNVFPPPGLEDIKDFAETSFASAGAGDYSTELENEITKYGLSRDPNAVSIGYNSYKDTQYAIANDGGPLRYYELSKDGKTWELKAADLRANPGVYYTNSGVLGANIDIGDVVVSNMLVPGYSFWGKGANDIRAFYEGDLAKLNVPLQIREPIQIIDPEVTEKVLDNGETLQQAEEEISNKTFMTPDIIDIKGGKVILRNSETGGTKELKLSDLPFGTQEMLERMAGTVDALGGDASKGLNDFLNSRNFTMSLDRGAQLFGGVNWENPQAAGNALNAYYNYLDQQPAVLGPPHRQEFDFAGTDKFGAPSISQNPTAAKHIEGLLTSGAITSETAKKLWAAALKGQNIAGVTGDVDPNDPPWKQSGMTKAEWDATEGTKGAEGTVDVIGPEGEAGGLIVDDGKKTKNVDLKTKPSDNAIIPDSGCIQQGVGDCTYTGVETEAIGGTPQPGEPTIKPGPGTGGVDKPPEPCDDPKHPACASTYTESYVPEPCGESCGEIEGCHIPGFEGTWEKEQELCASTEGKGGGGGGGGGGPKCDTEACECSYMGCNEIEGGGEEPYEWRPCEGCDEIEGCHIPGFEGTWEQEQELCSETPSPPEPGLEPGPEPGLEPGPEPSPKPYIPGGHPKCDTEACECSYMGCEEVGGEIEPYEQRPNTGCQGEIDHETGLCEDVTDADCILNPLDCPSPEFEPEPCYEECTPPPVPEECTEFSEVCCEVNPDLCPVPPPPPECEEFSEVCCEVNPDLCPVPPTECTEVSEKCCETNPSLCPEPSCTEKSEVCCETNKELCPETPGDEQVLNIWSPTVNSSPSVSLSMGGGGGGGAVSPVDTHYKPTKSTLADITIAPFYDTGSFVEDKKKRTNPWDLSKFLS